MLLMTEICFFFFFENVLSKGRSRVDQSSGSVRMVSMVWKKVLKIGSALQMCLLGIVGMFIWVAALKTTSARFSAGRTSRDQRDASNSI
jgi:hypothetical protein